MKYSVCQGLALCCLREGDIFSYQINMVKSTVAIIKIERYAVMVGPKNMCMWAGDMKLICSKQWFQFSQVL